MTGGEWATLAALVSGVLIVVSLLIPSRNINREKAWRVMCASNLRQIGLAIKMYASENNGAFPPALGTVLATQEITADLFVCPISVSETPATVARLSTKFATTQATQAALGRLVDDPAAHHCSYLYAGDGLNDTTATAEDVVAFDLPLEHGNVGTNVLYADCHVEWMNCRQGDPKFPEFDRFYADFKAGKKPLRWPASADPQP